MAREYGKLPTEIMGSNLPPAEAFYRNYLVYAGTSQFVAERREQATEQRGRLSTPQQQTDMIQEQERRAKQRESMEQAGMAAPTPEGQLQQMRELMQDDAGTDPGGVK